MPDSVEDSLFDFEPIVRLERPRTPSIWIDSSIVIKLWKLRQGEKIPPRDAERIGKLADLVGLKVRERKLLCLESHQREEFAGRAELDILEEFRSLTFGVDLRSVLTVREFQTEVAMRAFLAGEREIAVPLRVFFDSPPENQIDQVIRNGWLITAMAPAAEELVARRAQTKAGLKVSLEQLRKKLVAEGVTFDAQVEEERKGYVRAAAALFEKALSPEPSFWDSLGVTALTVPLRSWTDLGGPIGQFGPFLASRYLHSMPLPRIETRLMASLVTSNEVIQTGDSNDVDHLALVLPVASFIVTDKAMERRVRELGFDKEWGAEVYSLSSSDALFAKLTTL
jgi:hypothetical protein